jgi:hypothetical protein
MKRLYAAVLLFFVAPALAVPLAVANSVDGKTRLVLHRDACAFTETVTNLPKRATYHVVGQEAVEGCWGLDQVNKLVIFYFANKQAAAYPENVFGPAKEV